MKKFIALGMLIILLIPVFIFRSQIQAFAYDNTHSSPCSTPIRYSIGTIDPEFNLTKKEVLRRAQTAESIWEEAYSKNLFQYDPESSFTINVEYDERQGLRSEANELRSELESEQQTIDERVKSFNQESAQFKSDVEKLNSDIAYWNSQGGAPKEEYENLTQRQEELKKEQERLKNEASTLNKSTDSFNSLADTLNQTVNTFNEALEDRPEGGLYTQHGDSKSITVFFNNSENEFIYTVAHEMGHALGMEHVPDKNSIMYSQVNMVLIPSQFDLNALQDACREISIFSNILNNLKSVRFGQQNKT